MSLHDLRTFSPKSYKRVIILFCVKMRLCLADFPAPHEKINNMHAVCHGCNTKIASTEGESSYYHWRSTQEVQLVSTFCSSFHHKLEKCQTILVINMLRCPVILIICTTTPKSPWAPVVHQCFRSHT